MSEESKGNNQSIIQQESVQVEIKDAPVVASVPAPPVMLAAASNAQVNSPLQHPMIAALTNQVAGLGAENAKLRADMATLQQQLSASARDGIITAALSDGRLLPAMEKWARNISIEDLSEYLSGAQPIAILSGATQTQGKAPVAKENELGLNDDELAVCSQMMIDPKVFASQKSKIYKGVK